jgi:hypothetical protein
MAGTQNGHVLTLPLERSEPTACTKGLPRTKKLLEQFWHSGFKVLPVHHPCDLECLENLKDKQTGCIHSNCEVERHRRKHVYDVKHKLSFTHEQVNTKVIHKSLTHMI